MLQPEIRRTGLSLRFTANIGENTQFYAMANFYKTDTFASFTPLGFNGAAAAAESGGSRGHERHPAGLCLPERCRHVQRCQHGLRLRPTAR